VTVSSYGRKHSSVTSGLKRMSAPPRGPTGNEDVNLARALMAEDLAHYCGLANRPAPRLMLSRARRRWGSCARDGTIRINWRLVMAPEPVRRSVVAHEVAHLIHFDHSPAFHALLGELFEGDIRAVNRWLKREGRGLYLPFGLIYCNPMAGMREMGREDEAASEAQPS